MIVRMGGKRLYDLSDGSLSLEPIGFISHTSEEVFSAEQLLNDLGEYDAGDTVLILVTGFTDEDLDTEAIL